MIQKIKNHLLLFSSVIMLAVPAFVPTVVASAAAGCNDTITNGVASGANNAAGSGSSIDCAGGGVAGNNIGNIANNIVNIFSIIVGAVAVIMIIYGGFRYITSGGDSNRVGSAKNTLIYAIVGLIIVALAQIIVHFVLHASTSATTPGGVS
jgi:Type IV secretion system pilin